LNTSAVSSVILQLLAATQKSVCSQVAEWTDEFGFSPVAAKYVRLKPGSEIEKNRTYIVTTIVVSAASETVNNSFWHHRTCVNPYTSYAGEMNDLEFRRIT
jgi:hypothetical protein